MSYQSRAQRNRNRTASTIVTIAAALSFGVIGGALAQPVGSGAGADRGDVPITRILQAAKARLNLNTSQQVLWDKVVADTKAAHQAGRANRQRVSAALQAELAKPEPNLAAVAAIGDEVQQQNRVQHVAVRTEWLNLYATLSPEQKAVVRDSITQRLTRMQQFREKMRDHFGAHHGGSNG